MRLPELQEIPTTRDFIENFGGYNHNTRIGENEFYDMKNLTSSHYPVLATRNKRGTVPDFSDELLESVNYTSVAMIDYGGLWSLDVHKEFPTDSTGMWFHKRFENDESEEAQGFKYGYYIGGAREGYDSSVKRTLIKMGSNIVVMPDKKYFSTVKKDDEEQSDYYTLTDIESCYKSTEIVETKDITDENGETRTEHYKVKFTMCDMDGNDYTVDKVSKTEPTEDLTDDYIWLDTSTEPKSLKQYSKASGMWVSIATTYTKITSIGIGKCFEKNDAVRISGITVGTLKDLNNTNIIYAKDDDYIVVVGMIGTAQGRRQAAAITVERLMPDMDFVFESGNRLWGCRYGLNNKGEFVNEIYASKLGDFKNWEYFPGTSQDSYTASLGNDGLFTGGISYLGNPTFFRQNSISTVFGSYPAQYQIQTTECRGVQQGCHNSLTMIDGTLYYKSVGGVCAYTGSLPVEIGSALGEVGRRYYRAYGGAYRHKYYLGMHDALIEGDATWLYVYDTEKGMWHKEDEYNGQEFCYCNSNSIDQLYYLSPAVKADGSTSYDVKTIIGTGDKTDTEDIDWFAETGVIGCFTPDKKYVSRISFRLSLGIGTRVYIFAEYDSSGSWEQIGVITGSSLNSFTFPVRPKRCDHLRLRIEGTGDTKIYSISKTLEQGSDV